MGLGTNTLTAGGTQGFKVALRNTSNTNAYSAVAGTTEYAMDSVTFNTPTGSGVAFDADLTAAMIPNIAAYQMAANTEYSLIIYNATAVFGIARHTGYTSGTTNNFYTTSEGFSMLNTFRNQTTYSNNPSSYPSLMISFGDTTSPPAVPEPSSLALAGIATVLAGAAAIRRSRKQR